MHANMATSVDGSLTEKGTLKDDEIKYDVIENPSGISHSIEVDNLKYFLRTSFSADDTRCWQGFQNRLTRRPFMVLPPKPKSKSIQQNSKVAVHHALSPI